MKRLRLSTAGREWFVGGSHRGATEKAGGRNTPSRRLFPDRLLRVSVGVKRGQIFFFGFDVRDEFVDRQILYPCHNGIFRFACPR